MSTRKRSTLIKLVHMGARKLFGADDARRGWQAEISGRSGKARTSCKDMTDDQLENCVADLRDKGMIEDRPPKRAGRKPFNRSPYMEKIEAQLADMGLPWSYAEAIAWRITGGRGLAPGAKPGVERMEWVRNAKDFRGIIGALEKEQTLRNGMIRLNDQLARQGWTLDDLNARMPNHWRGVKWQRNENGIVAAWLTLDTMLEEVGI